MNHFIVLWWFQAGELYPINMLLWGVSLTHTQSDNVIHTSTSYNKGKLVRWCGVCWVYVNILETIMPWKYNTITRRQKGTFRLGLSCKLDIRVWLWSWHFLLKAWCPGHPGQGGRRWQQRGLLLRGLHMDLTVRHSSPVRDRSSGFFHDCMDTLRTSRVAPHVHRLVGYKMPKWSWPLSASYSYLTHMSLAYHAKTAGTLTVGSASHPRPDVIRVCSWTLYTGNTQFVILTKI